MPGVRQTSSGVVQTTAGVVDTVAIPDSGNLQHGYDPTEETTGMLSSWTDFVGNENLSNGAGATVVSNGINGNQSVQYDDTDDNLQASTVGQWNFLHDGSAFSFYIVVEIAGDGNYRNVASTQTNSGINGNYTGFSLARDDRTGSGFTDALRVAVTNGSGTSAVIDESYDNQFPRNSPEIYVVRFDGTDQYQIDRAKTNVASPTASNHTSNDANQALNTGDDADASPMNGELGDHYYYGVNHSDTTRDNVVDHLADKYDITL